MKQIFNNKCVETAISAYILIAYKYVIYEKFKISLIKIFKLLIKEN